MEWCDAPGRRRRRATESRAREADATSTTPRRRRRRGQAAREMRDAATPGVAASCALARPSRRTRPRRAMGKTLKTARDGTAPDATAPSRGRRARRRGAIRTDFLRALSHPGCVVVRDVSVVRVEKTERGGGRHLSMSPAPVTRGAADSTDSFDGLRRVNFPSQRTSKGECIISNALRTLERFERAAFVHSHARTPTRVMQPNSAPAALEASPPKDARREYHRQCRALQQARPLSPLPPPPPPQPAAARASLVLPPRATATDPRARARATYRAGDGAR